MVVPGAPSFLDMTVRGATDFLHALIVLGFYALLLLSPFTIPSLLKRLERWRQQELIRRDIELREATARAQAAALAEEWTHAPPLPTAKEITAHLTTLLPEHADDTIVWVLTTELVKHPLDQTVLRPAEVQAFYQRYLEASRRTIRAYLQLTEEPPRPPNSFRYAYSYTEHETSTLLTRLRDVLRTNFPDWKTNLNLPEQVSRDDYQKANGETDFRRYEAAQKQRDKEVDAIYDALSPAQTALLNTPAFREADRLTPSRTTRFLEIPPAARFAGTWIIAPPGRGKTNLLHHLITQNLATECAVVLMDSKGDMLNPYRNHPDAIVIDPYNVNINPLDLGSSVRSVEFLEYLFSSLLESGMTALQKTLFREVLTLLLQVPGATLETFRQVLTTGLTDEQKRIAATCHQATADFFLAGTRPEFNAATYADTKQQILWRLRLIMSNKYLRAIFTAPKTTIDFVKLLDRGCFVLIDNSKDALGEDGAEFFGRFFVAITWMAAVSRSKMRQQDKMPVYFYIDECHTVIRRDDKIATILDECFAPGNSVLTPHGYRPIETIAVGDMVITAIGARPVTSVLSRQTEQLYNVTLSNGHTIRVTGNHPFFSSEGWKPISTLAGSALLHYQNIHEMIMAYDQDMPLLSHHFYSGCSESQKDFLLHQLCDEISLEEQSSTIFRPKTRPSTDCIRVESVTLQEQGSTDQPTGGFTVYNLSVAGHPSYVVADCLVHNCRSQRVALTMAHQRIQQITGENVKDALGNCAVRLANSDDDAAALAPRFRVDAQALRLPVGQFAAYVRDITPTAITINVPLFDTDTIPQAEHQPEPAPVEPPVAAPAPTPPPRTEVEDF